MVFIFEKTILTKKNEEDSSNSPFAESPLIVDDLVISIPGGPKTTMVAFNKTSGELVWQSRSLNQKRSYASPILFEHNGIRQILGFTSKELIAVNPANGELVWHYPYFKH